MSSNEIRNQNQGGGGSYVEPGVKPQKPGDQPATPTTDWDAELETLIEEQTVTV